MSHKKSPSILNLALLIALAASPIAALYWSLESVIAQSPAASPTAPLPTAVPTGSAVRIDGTSSMATVNQSLKQRYEKESSGTTVDVGSNGSDAALQALLDGKVDIAAIGRPLTAAEKQKGLVPVSIGREKVAIITSSKNPYSGDITFDQFAKIFRGEITNWSQLGGIPRKIRFVDRPEASDTRQAFKSYPIFKAAPFQTGATGEAVSQDSTAEVIQKLGDDGIGYAVYSQVKGVDGIKIISMHQTLPDNLAYPFSQPRYFVAKATPAAATKDFLTYATGASGLAAIAAANQAEIAATTSSTDAVPNAAVSPDAGTSPVAVTSPSPEPVAIAPVPNATNQGLGGLIPWLLLVPAAILGWIWWTGRGRRTPAAPLSGVERSPQSSVVEVPTPPTPTPPTPTPSTPIPPIAPVSPIAPPSATAPVPPIALVPPIVTKPLTEPLTEPVTQKADHLPAVNPAIPGGAAIRETIPTGIAGAAGLAALASNSKAEPAQPPPYVEPPLDLPEPEAASAAVPVSPESSVAFPVSVGQPDLKPDLNLGLAAGAALAAGAGAAIWAKRSQDADLASVKVPPADVEPVVAIASIAELSSSDNLLANVDDGLIGLPASYGDSRIVLMPRDPQWAYAYWDVSESHKASLRYEGGDRLALRFYDVTDAVSQQNPHSLQQYDCEEVATDWYIPVPLSDRDYTVEIGYLANDGRWLMLARSAPVRIPPVYPSDSMEDQDVTILWDEELNGKTFSTPLTYEQKTRTIHDTMYELAHGTASDRVESSLQVSMQSDRSEAFPSGVGMGALTTSGIGMSGIGMSGVGMSGVGMSGVGMSGVGMSGIGISGIGMSGIGISGVGMSGMGMGALTTSGIGMSGVGMSGVGMSGVGMSGVGFFTSMPPIRSRKFWLVADAELIIHGATEPDATVTIAGRRVQLNPDGTFRFQMSFQDGLIDFPILAVAVDGVQTRAIHLKFDRETPVRNTNSKDDAIEEWFPS